MGFELITAKHKPNNTLVKLRENIFFINLPFTESQADISVDRERKLFKIELKEKGERRCTKIGKNYRSISCSVAAALVREFYQFTGNTALDAELVNENTIIIKGVKEVTK